jgi:acyl-homoserine-lactone acylase
MRKFMFLKIPVVAGLITLLNCGLTIETFAAGSDANAGSPNTIALKTKSEILWDEFGIPHIYGRDLRTVVRGYGYAQMENHAELILQNIAFARGRSAEYFGPGANNQNVNSDEQVITYGIPKRSEEWIAESDHLQRKLIDSFVAGANEYAKEHLNSIPPAFQRVLPVKPADTLALFQYTIHFNFMTYQSGVPKLIANWSAAKPVPQVEDVRDKVRKASNGWALAPARSTDGNAILIGNPQLGWGNTPLPGLGIYEWMEANLVVGNPNHPELNASGVTFIGSPFMGIGFNDYLGWTHTNNPIKNADLYELKLANGGYVFDCQIRPFKVQQFEIKVRQAHGSFSKQTVTVRASVHGPVVAQRSDRALALHVAGLNSPNVVSQYWNMMLARHLRGFIRANSRLQMPFFNVVYADRDGQIMYLFGGRQPRRSGGNYDQWSGIIPGDTKATLWTDTLNWRELPHTINPPGGFVQNSNDPPWFSSFPGTIKQSHYPPYIGKDEMEFRPQHGAIFLSSKTKFSLDEVTTGKMSTRMIMADRILPDLIAAAKVSGDADAIAAAAVLETWDRESDATSQGAVLFEHWYNLYISDPNSPKDDRWGAIYPAFREEFSPESPLTTPAGLRNAAAAVPYLAQAARELRKEFGKVDIAWGDVYRVVLADHDASYEKAVPVINVPGSGSPEPFGAMRKAYYFASPEPNPKFTYDGDTYVQAVEFTPKGAVAKALIGYGNASRSGSAHITDQVPYYERKQLRAVYRTRSEVEAHAVSRERY